MKLLLDSHLLLWAAGEPRRLPAAARKLINDARNELLFSAASLWEIVIKRSLGREDFRVDPRLLRRGRSTTAKPSCLSPASMPWLAIACRRGTRIPSTAFVAQSIIESVTLLTTDSLLAGYPGSVRRV